MSIRYVSNLALALVAAFELVAFQAFSSNVYAWLAFAGGITVVVIAVATGALVRSGAQRALSALTAVAGAWIVVSSLVFAASAVVWLGFSAAAAVAALAITGLTLHELRHQRVAAPVDLRSTQASATERAAAIAS